MKNIKVAILDLYNRVPNEGMRCIKSILSSYRISQDLNLDYEVFEVRYANEVPGIDFDIYISTGGPGSPFDGEGLPWENNYFTLLDRLWSHNQSLHDQKKSVFFICHSFQMMCRHFELGEVTRRRSTSFGIFPMYETDEEHIDPIFEGLPRPFYAVDSRDWQVVQPNDSQLQKLGASVLAIEKDRPHVDLERAVMAIRLSDEFVGTQFHPEADARGMSTYFQNPEKKQQVIDTYGSTKYDDMLHYLSDPQKIALTQQTIIPNFLKAAIGQWQTAHG